MTGDKAFARRGEAAWQEIPDFTGAFAPSGDFLAYLSAAKNVVKQAPESRAGIDYPRYTFEVDGLGFAAFVRDQLQAQLARQGKLPSGIQLDLPSQYKDMTGTGELWLRRDGLPLRQIIHAKFPPQSDYRVEADFTVNFSDYATGAQASSPIAFVGDFFASIGAAQLGQSSGMALSALSDFANQAFFIVLGLALVLLFVRYYRSQGVYTAISVYLTASMVFTP